MDHSGPSQLVRLATVGFAVLLSSFGPEQSSPAVAHDLYSALKLSRPSAAATAATFDLKALDGEFVRSKDLAGKVVLLNFWATWCGPCKEEMPSFERLRQQLDPARFSVLTITTDLQPEGIKQFLKQLRVDVPVLFDEDQEVSRSYMVRGLPTTVLIGKNGAVIGRAVGPRVWDSAEAVALLRQLVESAP